MFRQYTVWIDVNGFTRLTLINTTTGAATIFADMLALSNADWSNLNETGFTVNGAPAPTAAQFQTVSDAASLMFLGPAGEKTRLQLPAPHAGIFLADTVTVDPTAISTLIGHCVGTLAVSSGLAVVSFIGGLREPTSRENYQ